jgi:hypothetical protein
MIIMSLKVVQWQALVMVAKKFWLQQYHRVGIEISSGIN